MHRPWLAGGGDAELAAGEESDDRSDIEDAREENQAPQWSARDMCLGRRRERTRPATSAPPSLRTGAAAAGGVLALLASAAALGGAWSVCGLAGPRRLPLAAAPRGVEATFDARAAAPRGQGDGPGAAGLGAPAPNRLLPVIVGRGHHFGAGQPPAPLPTVPAPAAVAAPAPGAGGEMASAVANAVGAMTAAAAGGAAAAAGAAEGVTTGAWTQSPPRAAPAPAAERAADRADDRAAALQEAYYGYGDFPEYELTDEARLSETMRHVAHTSQRRYAAGGYASPDTYDLTTPKLVQPPLQASTSMLPTFASPAPPARCGLTVDGVNYPGNDLLQVPNVSSAELCCQTCAAEPGCFAWTWGKRATGHGASGVCALKGRAPRPALSEVSDPAFVSGQPVQVGRAMPVRQHKPGISLYCFSLMLPWGYEPSLLQLQYSKGTSIFGCDEYAVYSNQDMLVAPGVRTSLVNSSLQCRKGGEFNTALNAPIFMTLWAQIVKDGQFRFHEWTAKVDPDTVFFPDRLRHALARHRVDGRPRGVYLNNCKFGLHGPLEVFSWSAVYAWANGASRCTAHFNKLCSGPCKWGEDMFIDQCLSKVLGVTREDEPTLLLEDHCNPPPGWRSCGNQSIVAYHPFKDVDAYEECSQGSGPSATTVSEDVSKKVP